MEQFFFKYIIISSLIVLCLGSNVVVAESIDSQISYDPEVTEGSHNNIEVGESATAAKNKGNYSQENITSRKNGDKHTSPKYESQVKSKLEEKASKEIGNELRKRLKEINGYEIGYLKGNTIDIDLGDGYNNKSFGKTDVQVYMRFDGNIILVPKDHYLTIGAGYGSGKVVIPVGTTGYSSDGNLQFEVISSTKLRVKRVKNKKVVDNEKLPMNVPLKYDGQFYYQSGTEKQGGTGVEVQWSKAFYPRYDNYYTAPLLGTALLSYERLEENWQIAKGDINILDHISLEDSPEVQAIPKKSSFDMPTKAPSTPEEYVATSNTMTGGTLTYTWIDKLDVNAKSDQSVRVKIVDQLDDYKHEATTTLKFKANPDKTSVVVKDSSLYQGQTYNPEADNFVSGTDVNGDPLKWDDPNLKVSGDTVDTNDPKIYNQTLTYTYSLNGETKTKTSNYKVEVKEDQTKLELKDVELYVGEKWDPNLPFKNVTDKDGKKLTADDIDWYYIDEKKGEKNIDMSKPGTHKVRLVYLDATNKWKYGVASTITVKEDQTKLELQDTEMYVGETFDPDAAFKNVTDKDGKKLTSKDFSHYYIYPVGQAPGDEWKTKELDTSVAGKYKVRIFYFGNNKYSNEATITVKEKDLSLSVPNDLSFGNTVLGKAKKLYWDKKSEVSINNEGNRKWDLTTKLTGSSNQDFSNYLKFKDQSFKEGSVLIDSGASSKNITNELTEDKFIYVDYSTIKEIRKDKATLEWTLSPSTKGVEE